MDKGTAESFGSFLNPRIGKQFETGDLKIDGCLAAGPGKIIDEELSATRYERAGAKDAKEEDRGPDPADSYLDLPSSYGTVIPDEDRPNEDIARFCEKWS